MAIGNSLFKVGDLVKVEQGKNTTFAVVLSCDDSNVRVFIVANTNPILNGIDAISFSCYALSKIAA